LELNNSNFYVEIRKVQPPEFQDLVVQMCKSFYYSTKYRPIRYWEFDDFNGTGIHIRFECGTKAFIINIYRPENMPKENSGNV
jgi:hypothetical protein